MNSFIQFFHLHLFCRYFSLFQVASIFPHYWSNIFVTSIAHLLWSLNEKPSAISFKNQIFSAAYFAERVKHPVIKYINEGNDCAVVISKAISF